MSEATGKNVPGRLLGAAQGFFPRVEHDKALSHLRSMIAASKFPWVVSNYSTLKPLNIGGSKVDPFTIVVADGRITKIG